MSEEPVEEIRRRQVETFLALANAPETQPDCAVSTSLSDIQVRQIALIARDLKDEGHWAGDVLSTLLNPSFAEWLPYFREAARLAHEKDQP